MSILSKLPACAVLGIALFIGGCHSSHAGSQSTAQDASPVTSTPAAASNSAAPVADALARPPLYPGAKPDSTQGKGGTVDQPTLGLVYQFYRVSDSWDTVSRWYLQHLPAGWSSVARPGGGDLEITRGANSPETVSITGGVKGSEIVVTRFTASQSGH